MIKTKNVDKSSHPLILTDDNRQTVKSNKKKPKYQTIIRNLKSQIQELQRQVQSQEVEKDKQIKRLYQLVSQQSAKIKSLEQENTKLALKLRRNSSKLQQFQNANKISFTIGNTERLVEYSSTKKKKQYASVKLTDRTPRKTKQTSIKKSKHHPMFSKSTLDIIGLSPLPHRFNLSSEMQVPLVNVFNTEIKDSSQRNKIICRSLKNQYRTHKCGSRCDSKADQYR